MSTDIADSERPPVRVPNSTLPPVPLTDEQLKLLARQDEIVAVHVPDGRPGTVYTLAGSHQGDIMDFYVETADKYVKFGYEPAENGLAWRRFEPISKDDGHAGMIVNRLDEDYRPLEVPA